MTEIDELIVRIKGDISDLEASLKDANKAVEGFGKDFESGLKAANKGALITAGAVAAIGTASLLAASSFEEAFAQVNANVNGTDAELADLNASLRETAKTGPTTFQELASSAATFGSKFGIAAKDMEVAVQAADDFADATHQPIEQSTVLLGEFARAVGASAHDMAGLANTALVLQDSLGANASATLEFGNKLGPVAISLGIAGEAVLGFGAAFIAAGVDAGRGAAGVRSVTLDMASAVEKGTAAVNALPGMLAEAEAAEVAYQAAVKGGDKVLIKAAKSRMEATTQTVEDAGKAAEALSGFAAATGLSAQDFAAAFQDDAAGALTLFIEGLQKTSREGGDVLALLDAAGIKGDDAVSSFARLANSTIDVGDAMRQAGVAVADQSTLTDKAAAANDTAAARLQTLKNSFTDVGVSIGEDLLPVFQRLVDDFLTPLVGLIASHKKGFMVFGAAIGVIAGTILALNLALKAYKTIQAAIKVATAVWTGAQWLLNAALTANPIGLIVVGIAALIALIVIVVEKTVGWGNVWEMIVDGMKKSWEFLQKVALKVWDAISDAFERQWTAIKFVAKKAFEFLEFLFLNFTGVGLIIKHWDTIKATFQAGWDFIKNLFAPAGAFFSTLWDGIRVGAALAANSIKAIWEGVTSTIKGFINSMIDGVNVLIRGLNKIHVKTPDVLGVKGVNFGVNIPEIPKLEVGGAVLRDGLAMLHAGEVVMPAAQVERPFNAGMAGRSIVIQNLNVPLQSVGAGVNPNTIARSIRDALSMELRGVWAT